MTGKTHLSVGLMAGAILASQMTNAPHEAAAAVVALAGIGSLLPDIDKSNSKMGRKVWPVSKAIELVAGHRGAFHSLTLYAVLTIAAVMFFSGYAPFIYAAFIGVLTHLILDMLTPEGVPICWPFSSRRFHILSIKTGGFWEWIFSGVLTLVWAALIYKLFF